MKIPGAKSSKPGKLTSYSEPEQAVIFEQKIKRSVFIANLEACHDESEANNFLKRIVSQYRDATHNCRAYLIGEREYFSDDGEPSGTAGRPILQEIKRSGFVNVMLIVTRYFGGVKLGVRGLIDAYSGTAAKALELVKPKIVNVTRKFRVRFDYANLGLINHVLEACEILERNYDAKVELVFAAELGFCEKIFSELAEFRARKIIDSLEALS